MAANEYYHSNIPEPPSYDQVTGHSTDRLPATGYAAGAGATTHNHDDPSAPYHSRESQQSLASYNGAYHTAGRVTDGDQYSENIPLKAQMPYGNNPEWMHQQTQYPPSPGALEDRRPRANKRKGFFKKKPAWVTYILTLAQVIVFIVELIKAGECCTNPQK
jgi:hypothetical protein